MENPVNVENPAEETFDWDRDTWKAGIDPYFEQPGILVRHPIHSFNHFLENDIPEIMNHQNPAHLVLVSMHF